MKLKNITVNNFRCYSSLSLDLHPQLTILVANNGGGKTTLLDAIRKSIWEYLKGFDLAYTTLENRRNTILIKDILVQQNGLEMSRQFPSEIICTADYGKGDRTWKISADSENGRTTHKHNKASKLLNLFSKKQQRYIRDLDKTPIDLPIFAFYGTGRLWKTKLKSHKKKNIVNQVSQKTRTFAYANCLAPESNYKQFEQWFIDKSIQELQEQIKQLKSGRRVFTVASAIEDPIAVVKKAIDHVLKDIGWNNLNYYHDTIFPLVLEHKDKGRLGVHMMSDGIKNMVALVADIAYRCSLLNSHLGAEAALKSQGIVMIDEVDMHLHPQWQQTIVSGLTQAFPNIQFIMTTHSPQVLSTVAADSIRLLKQGTDAKTGKPYATAEKPNTQSRGITSADILAILMDIDPIPNVKEARWLSAYKTLIQKNQYKTQEAKELWGKLLTHFGQQHQAILECKRLIRLIEMKNKMYKNK